MRSFEFQKLCWRSWKCYFNEAQFIHNVCINHTLICDPLNSKRFVGETENIIKEFCLTKSFHFAQFNLTVLYLPYFKFDVRYI